MSENFWNFLVKKYRNFILIFTGFIDVFGHYFGLNSVFAVNDTYLRAFVGEIFFVSLYVSLWHLRTTGSGTGTVTLPIDFSDIDTIYKFSVNFTYASPVITDVSRQSVSTVIIYGRNFGNRSADVTILSRSSSSQPFSVSAPIQTDHNYTIFTTTANISYIFLRVNGQSTEWYAKPFVRKDYMNFNNLTLQPSEVSEFHYTRF